MSYFKHIPPETYRNTPVILYVLAIVSGGVALLVLGTTGKHESHAHSPTGEDVLKSALTILSCSSGVCIRVDITAE